MNTACQSSVQRSQEANAGVTREKWELAQFPPFLTSPISPPTALFLLSPLCYAEGCHGPALLTIHPLSTCILLPVTHLANMLQGTGTQGGMTSSASLMAKVAPSGKRS